MAEDLQGKTESFNVYIPFEKIDPQEDGTLNVWGRATQQVPDKDGEIMDFESSVPYWKQRMQMHKDLSDQNALLPLRAMHQPIAAGKVTDVSFNPDEKAIDICAHVVDENEVKKVRARVYNGFSVGGKYARRFRDPQSSQFIRYTADPREVSLVDVPAVPTAKFTLFKMEADDAQEPATVLSEQPPEWVGELVAKLDAFNEFMKAAKEEGDKQEAKLKAIGERVGIRRREGSPKTPPKGYPEDPAEYGDPANYAFPVDSSRASTAVGRFNGGNGAEQYTPRERSILGRRIASLASRFGAKYQYDPNSKQINRKEKQAMTEPNEINKLDVGGLVSQLQAAVKVGADMLGKDKDALKDALTMLMGSLDDQADGKTVAPDSAPAVSVPSQAIKAAAKPEPSPSDTTTTTSTPSTVDKAAAPAASTSSPSSTSTPTPEPKKTDDTDAYKAVNKRLDETVEAVNKLAGLVEKIVKGPALVKADDANSPLQALNAIVQKGAEVSTLDPEDEAILKALDDPLDMYAFQKAVRLAAGNDPNDHGTIAMAEQRVNNLIRKSVTEDLTKRGYTAEAYRTRIFNPQPPVQ